MGEIEELNEINRNDEDREALDRIADGIGEEYKAQFEGVVDINKLIDERDEALRLRSEAEELNTKQEKVIGQFQHLLRTIGDEGKCKGCGVPIWWIVNPKTGKKLPITWEGLNHFADCPKAKDFRK
jgi:hypothetical protein